MALETQIGVLITPGSTGPQSVAVPFSPKMVIFLGSPTSNGEIVNSSCSLVHGGADDSYQYVRGIYYPDGINQSPNPIIYDNPAFGGSICFRKRTGTGMPGTVISEISYLGATLSGFDINWNVVAGAGTTPVFYIALGGDDLEVDARTFTFGTSAGNYSISGLPFGPTGVILSNLAWGGFNFFSGPSNRVGNTCSAVGTSNIMFQRPNELCLFTDSSGTQLFADVVSLNPDGYTLSWAGFGSAITVPSITLGGVPCYAGSFISNTGLGSQVITGIPFRPDTIFFTTLNKAANTGQQNVALQAAHGVVDTLGNQITYAGASLQGGVTMRSRNYHSTSHCLSALSTVNPPALSARASFDNWTDDGLEITWGTNDGVAKEILFFAMGQLPASSIPKRLMLLGVGA